MAQQLQDAITTTTSLLHERVGVPEETAAAAKQRAQDPSAGNAKDKEKDKEKRGGFFGKDKDKDSNAAVDTACIQPLKAAVNLTLQRMEELQRKNSELIKEVAELKDRIRNGSAGAPVTSSVPSEGGMINKLTRPPGENDNPVRDPAHRMSRMVANTEVEDVQQADPKRATIMLGKKIEDPYAEFYAPAYDQDLPATAAQKSLSLVVGLKGFVLKKSNVGGIGIRVTAKRWLFLRNWRLLDFDDRSAAVPVHDLDLSHCFVRQIHKGTVDASPAVGVADEKDTKEKYIFEVFTPQSHYEFFVKDAPSLNLWYAKTMESCISGRLILYAGLGRRNDNSQRQGYLLMTEVQGSRATAAALDNFLLKENSYLRWCFVSKGVFAFFPDCKNNKKFTSVDLSRASLIKPAANVEKKLTLFLTTPTTTYLLSAQTMYELNCWYTTIQTVMEAAKLSMTDPSYWQGYLNNKTGKALVGTGKQELWCVLKDGHLSAYRSLNIKNPVASYRLLGASLKVHDDCNFDLILPDKTVSFQALGRADGSRCIQCLKTVIATVNVGPQIIRKGYLFKKKREGVLAGTRENKYLWFVLTKEKLAQYNEATDKVPAKEMDLCFARLILPENFKETFAFTVETPDKEFRLVAANKEDQTEWIEDIQRAIKAAHLAKMRLGQKKPGAAGAAGLAAAAGGKPSLARSGTIGAIQLRRLQTEELSNTAMTQSADANAMIAAAMASPGSKRRVNANASYQVAAAAKGGPGGAEMLVEDIVAAGDSAAVAAAVAVSGTTTGVINAKLKTNEKLDQLSNAARAAAEKIVLDQQAEKMKLNRHYSLPTKVRPRTLKEHAGVTIVFDNGSDTIRAGLAGEEFPRASFPSLVGYSDEENGVQSFFVGLNAMKENHQAFDMKITRPFGPNMSGKMHKTVDWEPITDMYEYVFANEFLGTDPREHTLMLSEPLGMSIDERKKFVSMIFETFEVPGICMLGPAALSLFSTGDNTGLSVVWGNRLQIQPVVNGYIIPQGQMQLPWGGAHLSQQIVKMISEEKEFYFPKRRAAEDGRALKESLCYVALDYEAEMKKVKGSLTKPFKCSNDEMIDVDTERFRIPEVLFNPKLGSFDSDGIATMIVNSVNKCEVDLRRQLMKNIIVSGGSTIFPNFTDRLQKELSQLTKMEVSVKAAMNRRYSCWIGGSIFACLPTYDEMMWSIEDFKEEGENMIKLQY